MSYGEEQTLVIKILFTNHTLSIHYDIDDLTVVLDTFPIVTSSIALVLSQSNKTVGPFIEGVSRYVYIVATLLQLFILLHSKPKFTMWTIRGFSRFKPTLVCKMAMDNVRFFLLLIVTLIVTLFEKSKTYKTLFTSMMLLMTYLSVYYCIQSRFSRFHLFRIFFNIDGGFAVQLS